MKKLIFILALLSFSTQAQTARGVKIGYIDMEYILEKVPDYAEANNQLEQKAQKWKQEIEITNNEAQIEEYGGVQYQTFLVGKYALFPLKEGKHSIESVKMTSILLIPVPKEVNYWGMRLQTMK